MTNTEKYQSEAMDLILSLVIKSTIEAEQINESILFRYGELIGSDPDDMSTWKYYLNLTGQLWRYDTTMYITTLEDRTTIELNKTTLKNYPITHSELLKFGNYYNSVVSKYPDQELIIKGIIYNINMDEALDAEDGAILAYSDLHIEEQEYDVIHKLNEYSTRFMTRWVVPGYNKVDNLYTAAVLGTLYSKLYLKVFNIRMSNINTFRVHSFHINEFFRSHYDIDSKFLDKQTRLWLYKTVKYIRSNLGNNTTLDLIIENLFTRNGIGIAKVMLTNKLPELNGSGNTMLPIYGNRDLYFVSKPVNNNYLLDNSDRKDTAGLINMELDDPYIDTRNYSETVDEYVNRVNSVINKKVADNQITKIFRARLNNSYILEHEVDFKDVLDNWIVGALDNTFIHETEFIDPNTGVNYKLNTYQGFLMLIKLLSKLSGVNDSPIVLNYTANMVIDTRVTYEMLIENTINSDINEEIAKQLIDIRPRRYVHILPEELLDYIKKVNYFRSTIWNMSVNMDDMILGATLREMRNRLFKPVTVNFSSNKTIDELLSENYIDFTFVDGYNYTSSIILLTEIFTGYNLRDDELTILLNKYLKVAKKLTSYTVQFIDTITTSYTTGVRHAGLSSIRTPGIINIKEGSFSPLEEYESIMDSDQFPDYNELWNREINLPKMRSYRQAIGNRLLNITEDDVHITTFTNTSISVRDGDVGISKVDQGFMSLTMENVDIPVKHERLGLDRDLSLLETGESVTILFNDKYSTPNTTTTIVYTDDTDDTVYGRDITTFNDVTKHTINIDDPILTEVREDMTVMYSLENAPISKLTDMYIDSSESRENLKALNITYFQDLSIVKVNTSYILSGNILDNIENITLITADRVSADLSTDVVKIVDDEAYTDVSTISSIDTLTIGEFIVENDIGKNILYSIDSNATIMGNVYRNYEISFTEDINIGETGDLNISIETYSVSGLDVVSSRDGGLIDITDNTTLFYGNKLPEPLDERGPAVFVDTSEELLYTNSGVANNFKVYSSEVSRVLHIIDGNYTLMDDTYSGMDISYTDVVDAEISGEMKITVTEYMYNNTSVISVIDRGLLSIDNNTTAFISDKPVSILEDEKLSIVDVGRGDITISNIEQATTSFEVLPSSNIAAILLESDNVTVMSDDVSLSPMYIHNIETNTVTVNDTPTVITNTVTIGVIGEYNATSGVFGIIDVVNDGTLISSESINIIDTAIVDSETTNNEIVNTIVDNSSSQLLEQNTYTEDDILRILELAADEEEIITTSVMTTMSNR